MSDRTPAERIASVLLKYSNDKHDHLPGYGDDPTAADVYREIGDDAEHLAAEIVTALGLREETRIRVQGAPGSTPITEARYMSNWKAI